MASKLPTPQVTLSLREVNRATLSRQMLLQHEDISAVEAIERLAGLQAQYSPSPYIGLWTRLLDFKRESLTNALLERQAVKATLMRRTLHIVSARDYPFFATVMSEALQFLLAKDAEDFGIDLADLHQRIMSFASTPRLNDDLIDFVSSLLPSAAGAPSYLPRRLAMARSWLLHSPPSGIWRYFGKNPYVSAHSWLGPIEEPAFDDAVTYMLRRYLAAFGPATRPDVLQWSGLRQVRMVDIGLEKLGDDVVAFRGEDGKILYDLRSSPRPGADIVVPVRYLPKWDNILLAHQNRERVLPNIYRKTVIAINGDVLPTFLVDGIVAGAWSTSLKGKSAILSLQPFEPLAPDTISALEEEGDKLVRFIEPEAVEYNVRVVD